MRGRRKQVIAALTALARETGVGGKLPTMLDLSQSMEVAIGTLDFCLGVMESQGIIYRKHGSGIYVTPRILQKRVGIVFGRNIFAPGASPFYSILLNQCQAKARERHLRFSFYIDTPDLGGIGGEAPVHQDLADALTENKISGLVVLCRASVEQEEWLIRQSVPVVSFGDASVSPFRVSLDDSAMIEMAVDALVEEGCGSIGLVGGHSRQDAPFRTALRKHGLTAWPEWIHFPRGNQYIEDQLHETAGREAVIVMFASASTPGRGRRGMPDGLVIVDDIMAKGSCIQFESLGWTVGKDIRIACPANKGSAMLSGWESALILIEVDPQEIVDALFGLLEPLMDGAEPPEKSVMLKCFAKKSRPTRRGGGTR